MKVLQVIRSLDPTTGGPAFAVRQMASALVARGVTVDVVTTSRDGERDALSTGGVSGDGVRYLFFQRGIGKVWSFSLELSRWLNKNVHNYDIVHITGVFTFPAIIAAWRACKMRVPYIVRPAGTLDSYALSQKAWRKRMYFGLFVKGVLQNASAIHATSKAEHDQLLTLGLRVKCVVIPLSVTPPKFKRRTPSPVGDLAVLFMSRIHPIKGLPTLLDALSILHSRGERVTLTIAGSGTEQYENDVKHRAQALGLMNVVSFVGFAGSVKKDSLLEESDLFVLPSYQESFGIAVVEAMAAGIPVIVSDRVALAEEIQRGAAGVVVPVDAPGILAEKILSFADANYRYRTGENGRQLVLNRFTAERQSEQLLELYRGIVEFPSRD